MGGRGKKRREKNYLKSHGGDKRLPPPPTSASYEDPLPFKLRKLMSLTSSQGDEKSETKIQSKGKKGNVSGNKPHAVVREEPKSIDSKSKTDKNSAMNESKENEKADANQDKNKKKRKRKEVNDMRFEAEMQKLGVISVRKQRKKDYLKNKKKKQKEGAAQQALDLPQRDVVKFGDVVQAPPKLPVITKALKKPMNASHEHLSLKSKAPKKPMSASNERLRLQAIEAYRNRKGASRLGIELPSLSIASDLE